MVAAPSPAISSGRRPDTATAPGSAVPSLPVRTVDLYGAVTLFSIRAVPAGEYMGLGADQLEALTECVELINTGRRSAGASSPDQPGGPGRSASRHAGQVGRIRRRLGRAGPVGRSGQVGRAGRAG